MGKVLLKQQESVCAALTKRALADLNKMCLNKRLKGEGRVDIMIMGYGILIFRTNLAFNKGDKTTLSKFEYTY